MQPTTPTTSQTGQPGASSAPPERQERRALSVEQAAAEIAELDAPARRRNADPSNGQAQAEASQPRDPQGRYTRSDDADPAFDDPDASLEGDEAEFDGELDADQELEGDAEIDDQADDDGVEPMFEVTIDGVKRTVTQSEMIKGFQLAETSYQRLQQVAEQRREVEGLQRQAETERTAYTQLLGQLGQWLEGQAPSAQAIEQLMMQDPVQGYQAKQLREQILAKAHEFMAGYTGMVQGASALEQRAQSEALARATAELPQQIPEWQDATVRAEELEQIAVYMLREGFKADELAQIADARAMKLARKAWMYDQLQARGGPRMAAAKAQQSARSTQTQQQPTQRRPASLPAGERDMTSKTRARRNEQIAQRARQTGSLEDVAAWIGAE